MTRYEGQHWFQYLGNPGCSTPTVLYFQHSIPSIPDTANTTSRQYHVPSVPNTRPSHHRVACLDANAAPVRVVLPCAGATHSPASGGDATERGGVDVSKLRCVLYPHTHIYADLQQDPGLVPKLPVIPALSGSPPNVPTRVFTFFWLLASSGLFLAVFAPEAAAGGATQEKTIQYSTVQHRTLRYGTARYGPGRSPSPA